ncbi:hypothetical protein [Bacillus sp. V2I10]|uniref:hypothetical protein n=1 Tax=Bacillus sp. V2I10 TaxID=3042276 RepID=UPI0027868445|nr:hypothetical protein [Bacillus sp. V2I10]MDQ0859826.1 hypothetical protein [Bacillus sp. V2I10]
MKRIYGLLGVALLASTIAGGNTYAASKSSSDELKFNWEEAWENIENDPNYYPQTVDFVEEDTSDSSEMRTASFSNYATGTTNLRFSNYYVYSKGVTNGQHLWTTTSAQTNLRNVDAGYITIKGPRDTAVAFGDAVSEAKKKYIPLDGNFFTGMTLHTATMNGAIYEKATSDSDIF